MGNKNNSGHH